MQSDFELKKVHVRDMDQERKDGGAHRDCSYTGPRIWCYKLMIDLWNYNMPKNMCTFENPSTQSPHVWGDFFVTNFL